MILYAVYTVLTILYVIFRIKLRLNIQRATLNIKTFQKV